MALYIVLSCVIVSTRLFQPIRATYSIEIFTSSNLRNRGDIELVLAFMDLGMCLLEDTPILSAEASSIASKLRLDIWERSNRSTLMVIKRSII